MTTTYVFWPHPTIFIYLFMPFGILIHAVSASHLCRFSLSFMPFHVRNRAFSYSHQGLLILTSKPPHDYG